LTRRQNLRGDIAPQAMQAAQQFSSCYNVDGDLRFVGVDGLAAVGVFDVAARN
jgi:hypothetical protein